MNKKRVIQHRNVMKILWKSRIWVLKRIKLPNQKRKSDKLKNKFELHSTLHRPTPILLSTIQFQVPTIRILCLCRTTMRKVLVFKKIVEEISITLTTSHGKSSNMFLKLTWRANMKGLNSTTWGMGKVPSTTMKEASTSANGDKTKWMEKEYYTIPTIPLPTTVNGRQTSSRAEERFTTKK